MIKVGTLAHREGDGVDREGSFVADADIDAMRFERMFAAHYVLVWRSLRRFGVPTLDVDDAVQEVFLVAARRLADIDPDKERSFLCGTAVRVASDVRRARSRRPETLGDDVLSHLPDHAPAADVLADRRRARALLDEVLERLPDEQRVVFVLFELEGMTMAEIAEVLTVPAGTVASRLRRAREAYTRQIERLRKRVDREAP